MPPWAQHGHRVVRTALANVALWRVSLSAFRPTLRRRTATCDPGQRLSLCPLKPRRSPSKLPRHAREGRDSEGVTPLARPTGRSVTVLIRCHLVL